MARIKFYNKETAQWEYADQAYSGQNVTLSTVQIAALDGMFRVCAYDDSKDVSGVYAAFKSAFGITDSGEEEPDEPETPVVTLTSISATYSGGDVPVGTAVADLTGIVVTAHYSDGSSEPVTGYTLSGTIAEGSNTVTVSYGGKTTTFTVTGVAESVATYGLHHDAGYTGKMLTPLKTTTAKAWNVDKIVLDIDFITTTLPTQGKWHILLLYQYVHSLGINNDGKWTLSRSEEKVTADKTPSEVMGNGRMVVTFNIEPAAESNELSWVILDGGSAPEITWYSAKFYSGDTLVADLKPTANVGEMYDSVSGKTSTFTVTEGLTLVEV